MMVLRIELLNMQKKQELKKLLHQNIKDLLKLANKGLTKLEAKYFVFLTPIVKQKTVGYKQLQKN